MPELNTTYDYMRLCVAPHNLIYVKMLFMLSSFTEGPLFRCGSFRWPHNLHTWLISNSLPRSQPRCSISW